jgi:hypothetical protein
MSKALAGLRQAVNDAIEATTNLDVESVRRLDHALAERRIITPSGLRRRYWGKNRAVIIRRHIRNDAECVILNDTTCAIPDHERAALQSLVEAYETHSV